MQALGLTFSSLGLVACLSLTPGVAVAQSSLSSSSSDAPAGQLPSVEKLMAQAVEAAGGKRAFAGIKNLHVVSKLEMMGQVIDAETMWSRDGGRMVVMKSPMGEMTFASDGKEEWTVTPMGTSLMRKEQSGQLGMASMHMMMFDLATLKREQLKDLKTVGQEMFADQKCYKCRYVDQEDDSEGFMYFGVDSRMPVGMSQHEDGPNGSRETHITFGDWREVSGVKLFHVANVSSPEDPMEAGEMLIVKIAANTLEADAFAMPDEIKKLVDARGKGPTTAPAGGAGGISIDELTPDLQKQATQMLTGMKRSEGTESMSQALRGLEMAVGFAPSPEEKKMIEYVVQELKKEIAARGG